MIPEIHHPHSLPNAPSKISNILDMDDDYWNTIDLESSPEESSPEEEKTEVKTDDKDKEDDVDTKRKKITVRGLSGLRNIGNTCYMNTTLQCLKSIPYLDSYLRKYMFKTRLENNIIDVLAKKTNGNIVKKDEIKEYYTNTITHNLAVLFETMWSENASIEPKSFKQLISKRCETFRGSGQNDSQELLNFILDNIHEEIKAEVDITYNIPESVEKLLNIKLQCCEFMEAESTTEEESKDAYDRYKKYVKEHPTDVTFLNAFTYWYKYIENSHSIISDLFTGLYQSEIICKSCKTACSKFEPFTILSIETDSKTDNTTLGDCLKDFSSEELLTGENSYSCETCDKKTDASKSINIWEPPEILIVQLKRFKNVHIHGAHYKQEKIESIIKFPLENLTLDDNYSPINKKDYVYDLVAISEHMGTCDYGHYIAHCKNQLNGEWYEFNDNSVFHVSKEKIEDEIVGKNAYILFYIKRVCD